MVWTRPVHELAHLVIAPFKGGAASLNRVHNEFHNGSNMGKLGKVVACHQPHLQRPERVRSENSFETVFDIANHARQRRQTQSLTRRLGTRRNT